MIALVCFPLVVLSFGLYYCSVGRGFQIDKISSKLSYNETWEIEPLSQEEKEHLIHEVFSQTFYYLGSGNQTYAFVSSDNKYVVKFFKMHRLLPKHWLTGFPFSLFEKYRFDHVEKKQLYFESTFTSFKDAYQHFRKESGLMFLHLNKSRDLKTSLSVIRYDGKKFLIDLDSKEFIVQHKAERVCDYLADLLSDGKLDQARLIVREWLGLIAVRCKKGFADQDVEFRSNFGVLDGHVVLIDCGNLYADPSLKHPTYFQAEILRAAEKLELWSSEYYPELTGILQEEAHRVVNQNLF